MNFKEKCGHATKLVESQRASFLKTRPPSFLDFLTLPSAPPSHRLLWALGVELKPPHFSSYKDNKRFFGLLAGTIWIPVILSLFYLANLTQTPLMAVLPSLIFPLIFWPIFGGMYAKRYRREREFYQIPLWDDFHPEISEKV